LDSNGRNKRTVWSINTRSFPGAHFATFPSQLVEPCILASTRPGDFVLDPFFGSGTVGVVCQEYNRKFIGVELNSDYVNMACERLEEQAGSNIFYLKETGNEYQRSSSRSSN
jgi:site-specific DNA-methyltransferase (adenine-specific)